ncbi:MAG: hypothetical protein M3680_32535 [Myxococcota bacterium]|nr:hypothetical protein [Myxococcota bacterium]
MTTLTVLSGPWRRPYDRRETPLWLASIAGPAAWVGALAGMSVVAALAITILAGLLASLQLGQLHLHGDRSRQRSWFLAQTGVTLATVSMILISLDYLVA